MMSPLCWGLVGELSVCKGEIIDIGGGGGSYCHLELKWNFNQKKMN